MSKQSKAKTLLALKEVYWAARDHDDLRRRILEILQRGGIVVPDEQARSLHHLAGALGVASDASGEEIEAAAHQRVFDRAGALAAGPTWSKYMQKKIIADTLGITVRLLNAKYASGEIQIEGSHKSYRIRLDTLDAATRARFEKLS